MTSTSNEKKTSKIKSGLMNKRFTSKVQKVRQMLHLKEVAQKRYKIYSLEKQINENLYKMGELLYRQKKGEKEKELQTEMDRLIEENKNLETEIETLEKQIKELHSDTLSCPNCGQALPKDGVFCSYCGYDMIKQQKKRLNFDGKLKKRNKHEQLVCLNCNENLPEGGIYCNYCGEKVTKQKEKTKKFQVFRRKNNDIEVEKTS